MNKKQLGTNTTTAPIQQAAVGRVALNFAALVPAGETGGFTLGADESSSDDSLQFGVPQRFVGHRATSECLVLQGVVLDTHEVFLSKAYKPLFPQQQLTNVHRLF